MKRTFAVSYMFFLLASSAWAGQLNLTLTTDNAGLPGTIIETVPISGFGLVPSIQASSFVTSPTLTAGTPYWLVVAPPDLTNEYLGWDRVCTGIACTISALTAQRIGDGPWSVFTGYEGTLRILDPNGATLFDDFLPDNGYDTTSGWALGGGSVFGNGGYSQALQFTPTASGDAYTIEIAAFDLHAVTTPEPTTMVLAGSSALILLFRKINIRGVVHHN